MCVRNASAYASASVSHVRPHRFGMYQIMPFTPTRKTLKTKAFTGVDKFLSHLHQLGEPEKEKNG